MVILLALADVDISSLPFCSFFIDDIRLCRRIVRDVKERGRDVAGVLH